MARRLIDRHVVITGGSRGLGRALARRCAAEGARITATATRREHVDGLIDEFPDVRAVALDLGDPESIASAANAIARVGAPVDVLINNAGILGARVRLADYPMDTWREVIEISVNGTLQFTQSVLPLVPDGGAIINVTSGAAGRPNWGAYGISRLALNGITQVMRAELADRRIRCVAINPGGVRTEMRADAYPEEDPDSIPPPEARLGPFVAVAEGADPGWFVEAKEWRE